MYSSIILCNCLLSNCQSIVEFELFLIDLLELLQFDYDSIWNKCDWLRAQALEIVSCAVK